MKKISLNQKDVIITALSRKYNRWSNDDINFEIYEIEPWYWRDDYKLVLGINWAAIGTVSTEQTIKFANSLIDVCKVVDRINAEEFVIDKDLEDDLDTKEAFNNAVESFTAFYLEG